MDPVLFNQLVVFALIALAAFAVYLLLSKPLPDRPWWAPADARGAVALAVIVMAAGVLFYRVSNPSTTDDKVLDMMLTILFGTAFVAIINFLFGSSRGSVDKDDTINKIALAPTPPTPSAPAAPVPLAPPQS